MASIRFTEEEVRKLVALASGSRGATPEERIRALLPLVCTLVPNEVCAVFLGARTSPETRCVSATGRDPAQLAACGHWLHRRSVNGRMPARLVGPALAGLRPLTAPLGLEPGFAIGGHLDGHRAVLWIAPPSGGRPFTPRERCLLELVWPLVREALAERTRSEALDVLDSRLGRREAEVARLAARGLGDREIALALKIGYATVRTHLQRAFAKLGVTSRTALAWFMSAPAKERSPRRGGPRGGRRRARGR